MIRVAQIIDNVYYGGAQTMQVHFARQMADRPNIHVTVISLDENVHQTPIPDRLSAAGVNQMIYFPGKNLVDPRRFWRLLRYLRAERFDIIQTHLTYANTLGTLAARLAGIPVIAGLRNAVDDDGRRFQGLRSQLETLAINHCADAVMCVGDVAAQSHQPRLKHPIRVIINSVPLQAPLAPADRQAVRQALFPADDDDIQIIFAAGRLAPQKAFHDLITAFQQVHAQIPGARLAIAGDGTLRSALQAQIDSCGLREVAQLLGMRDDIPALLGSVDVFASSSLWEGVSVAILEAMAARLPIVATQVSDVPPPEVALLSPAADPTALAANLMAVLQDDTLRDTYAAHAGDYVARYHSPHAWADSILQLYADLLPDVRVSRTTYATTDDSQRRI